MGRPARTLRPQTQHPRPLHEDRPDSIHPATPRRPEPPASRPVRPALGSFRRRRTRQGRWDDREPIDRIAMTQALKFRLRFAKRDDLRLASHHDMMRCLERLVRRAGIPIALTGGFSPRPRIVFALALGLGIEGLAEVVDLELTEPTTSAELLKRLAESSPPGIEWLEARAMDPKAPAPRPIWAEYQLPIPEDRRESAAQALESLLAQASCVVIRRRPDRREIELDLRPFLLDARLTEEGRLLARLKVTPEGSIRPEELLEALGLRDLLDVGVVLTRAWVELESAPAAPVATPDPVNPPSPSTPETTNRKPR